MTNSVSTIRENISFNHLWQNQLQQSVTISASVIWDNICFSRPRQNQLQQSMAKSASNIHENPWQCQLQASLTTAASINHGKVSLSHASWQLYEPQLTSTLPFFSIIFSPPMYHHPQSSSLPRQRQRHPYCIVIWNGILSSYPAHFSIAENALHYEPRWSNACIQRHRRKKNAFLAFSYFKL